MNKNKGNIKGIFGYLEPLWCGRDGRISLRQILAIAFSIDFINSFSFAIHKWANDRNLSDLAMTLGIEAGLIMGLLGLTAWTNISAKKIETEATLNKETTDSK